MHYFVYAIYSKKLDVIYIGQTNSLERRLNEHQKGYSTYTSKADDWVLFYSEECASRSLAFKREKQLKSSAGRRFLREELSKLNA